MKLLAQSKNHRVYSWRGNKFQITNQRKDRRYETDFERIGVFNTLIEAIKFMKGNI